VDEPPVPEVAVPPHAIEQRLPTEHSSRARRQLAQQTELRLRQMDLLLIAQDEPLVGRDLEVAEPQPGVTRLRAASAAEQRPDARGELLGRERLREVVVRTGL